MRLSEAIALGRTLVARCRACGSTGDGAQPGDGCVLDIAVLATSGKGNWMRSWHLWPWLKVKVSDRIPSDPNWNEIAYYERIYALFDGPVMRGEMTLDQLIDYVRSIEPIDEPSLPMAIEQNDHEQVPVYQGKETSHASESSSTSIR